MSEVKAYGLPMAIMQALLNKSPKEGPRYVPMALDFATVTAWSVDLTPYVQGGQLSAIQSFFIDNSQNTAPITIAMGIGGGQTIQLNAGQQGWVSCLLNNNPQFVIASTGTAATVFACNFQMFNAVWDANSNATAASTNLSEVGGAPIALGQTVMADSLPVTIATNQTPISVSPIDAAAHIAQLALTTAVAVAFGTDITQYLNAFTVTLDGYTLTTANTLTIHDGGGNVLATVAIPPETAATTIYSIYAERSLAIAMSNAGVAPSAILGTAPTAGSVLLNVSYT